MLKIGGVPEHFNLPWKLHDGDFTWTDVAGGTGAMPQMLIDNELDVAIMLTEGAVKAIEDGLEAIIVDTYTDSPLTWGVHKRHGLEQPEKNTFAVSRMGSGSHLMAYLWIKKNEITEPDFKVCDNIDGAISELNRSARLFLWEKYMTSPYVDRGTLDRIDEILTPWPAFVYVMSTKAVNKLNHLKELMDEVYRISSELMQDRKALTERVSADYSIKIEDARAWSEDINWAQPGVTDIEELVSSVKAILRRLGILL
jgi:hypothetical protein